MLGKGSFGKVYRVYHAIKKKNIALKILEYPDLDTLDTNLTEAAI
jgi:serine/threonine protein kinase